MRLAHRLVGAAIVLATLASSPASQFAADPPAGGGPTMLIAFGHEDLGHNEILFYGVVHNPVPGLYVIVDGVIGPFVAIVNPIDGTWSVQAYIPPDTTGMVEATLYTPFGQPINSLDDLVTNR